MVVGHCLIMLMRAVVGLYRLIYNRQFLMRRVILRYRLIHRRLRRPGADSAKQEKQQPGTEP
jgi:hypothetical protein